MSPSYVREDTAEGSAQQEPMYAPLSWSVMCSRVLAFKSPTVTLRQPTHERSPQWSDNYQQRFMTANTGPGSVVKLWAPMGVTSDAHALQGKNSASISAPYCIAASREQLPHSRKHVVNQYPMLSHSRRQG